MRTTGILRGCRGIHTRSADYVVVGAGTAGCTIARRLADALDAISGGGGTVLVIEAGRHLNPADKMHAVVHDPMQYGDGLHTDVDWGYFSTKQPELADR